MLGNIIVNAADMKELILTIQQKIHFELLKVGFIYFYNVTVQYKLYPFSCASPLSSPAALLQPETQRPEWSSSGSRDTVFWERTFWYG